MGEEQECRNVPDPTHIDNEMTSLSNVSKEQDERKGEGDSVTSYPGVDKPSHGMGRQIDMMSDAALCEDVKPVNEVAQNLAVLPAHAENKETWTESTVIDVSTELTLPDSCAYDKQSTTTDLSETYLKASQISESCDRLSVSKSSPVLSYASQMTDGLSPTTSACSLPRTQDAIEIDSKPAECTQIFFPGVVGEQSTVPTIDNAILTTPQIQIVEKIELCTEPGVKADILCIQEEQSDFFLPSKGSDNIMLKQMNPEPMGTLGSPFESLYTTLREEKHYYQTTESFPAENNRKRHFDDVEDSRGPRSSPPKHSKPPAIARQVEAGDWTVPKSQNHAPTPKRMTLASQKRSHERLAAPFRSPLLPKTNVLTRSSPPMHSNVSRSIKTLDSSDSTHLIFPDYHISSSPIRSSSGVVRNRPLLRSTRNAASPFKSPVIKKPLNFPSDVQSSPTISCSTVEVGPSYGDITELERKVQELRRAIKIERGEETKTLEKLVRKWRSAGRLVSQELWTYLRECPPEGYAGSATGCGSDTLYPGTNIQTNSGAGNWGWSYENKSVSSDCWGWATDADGTGALNDDISEEDELPSGEKLQEDLFRSLNRKITNPRTTILPPTPRGAYFTNNDSFSNTLSHHEEIVEGDTSHDSESSVRSWNLGAMLTAYGISHQTLGWVEDEEDFVD